jgi:redox-sensing transcriptional repressor
MENPTQASRRRAIAEASLRRLPAYHHLLEEMMIAGVPFVSCGGIGRALNLDPTQVRKDIEATGIIGKPKVGYPLPALVHWIEDFLGWNNTKEAVIAGAGSLGNALLGYQKFRQFGINIVAAFDTDPDKFGALIYGKWVLPLEQLRDFTHERHIHLGVIATPSAAAQSVADLMVSGGIRAIWNFAPVHLRVPDLVILQNEDLYPSLASLSFKLEKRMVEERDAAMASTVSGPAVDVQNPDQDRGNS